MRHNRTHANVTSNACTHYTIIHTPPKVNILHRPTYYAPSERKICAQKTHEINAPVVLQVSKRTVNRTVCCEYSARKHRCAQRCGQATHTSCDPMYSVLISWLAAACRPRTGGSGRLAYQLAAQQVNQLLVLLWLHRTLADSGCWPQPLLNDSPSPPPHGLP